MTRSFRRLVMFTTMLLVFGIIPLLSNDGPAGTTQNNDRRRATNRILMASDQFDYIGQGRNYLYTSGITAYAGQSGSHVHVDYRNPDDLLDYWSFDFASPDPEVPLKRGVYLNAERYLFNSDGTAGLDVSGQGRGSNTLTGQFTIHRISVFPSGTLEAISVSFEQHSEGLPPALRGLVQYDVQNPP